MGEDVHERRHASLTQESHFMPSKLRPVTTAAHAFADFDDYKAAVFECLVQRGLSRPSAEMNISCDLGWMKANWLTLPVDEAAERIFAPDVDESLEGNRDAVALFLDTYGLGTGHTEAVLDGNKGRVSEAHKGRLPPWAVAADLLYKAGGVRPYPVVEAADPRIFLDVPQQTRELLSAASALGLLGATEDDVALTIINQGLLALVRDGLLTLKRKASARG